MISACTLSTPLFHCDHYVARCKSQVIKLTRRRKNCQFDRLPVICFTDQALGQFRFNSDTVNALRHWVRLLGCAIGCLLAQDSTVHTCSRHVNAYLEWDSNPMIPVSELPNITQTFWSASTWFRKSPERVTVFSSPKAPAPVVRLAPPVMQWVPGALTRQALTLTTDVHVVPRFRMKGVVVLLHLYAFMPWTGTPLPFTQKYKLMKMD
jgi:hypothetical protein